MDATYTLSAPALNKLRATTGNLFSVAFWQDAGDPRRFGPVPSNSVVRLYYNQLWFSTETESEMMDAVLEEVIHGVSREFSNSYVAEKLNITIPETGATGQVRKALKNLCFPAPGSWQAMSLLRIALLLTVVVVSISWSQNEVAQVPPKRKITFVAYSSFGKRLENCRLQSVKSSGAAHGGDAVPIFDDMQIERVDSGKYKVLYLCSGRLLYDENVEINSRKDLVILIDRSGGDIFKFKSGFRQGLSITWASPLERPRDSQDIGWAKLGHLVDGESWLRLIPGDKKQITFPAEPGIYVLTFSMSTNAVCTLLLEVMSYSSEAIVLDEQRCKVTSVAGMRVRGSMPMQN